MLPDPMDPTMRHPYRDQVFAMLRAARLCHDPTIKLAFLRAAIILQEKGYHEIRTGTLLFSLLPETLDR